MSDERTEDEEGRRAGDADGATDEPVGDDATAPGKDEAIRSILKGAGVVYTGLVLNMLLAFLAQRFAAVYLTISGFGGLTTGTALLNVGGILAGLGLSTGLTRYLPRVDEDARRPLAVYAAAVTIPLGVALGGLTVVFADEIAARVFGDPSVAVSILVFGAAIPFAALFNLAVGGIRGQKISRYRVYVRNLLHPSARFGLIIAAVVLGVGQGGFALAYALPFVAGAVVATLLFERSLPDESDRRAGRREFPNLLRFSLPLTVSGLASFVYRSIDIFLLLYFLGSRSVGVYGVAYAFARLLGMFATALNYLGTPISSELESEDRVVEAIDVQQSMARWLAILSVAALVPTIVFASELLGGIYRPAYAVGGAALSILAVGFAAKNVLLVHGPILHALGRSKVAASNTVTAAVLNVGLNLWLIPRYGIEGAAIATTVSYVVLGTLPVLEIRYFAGVTALSRRVLTPLLVALPLVGASVLARPHLPGGLLGAIGFGVVFSVLYAVALLVVQGLTPADVMVVRSLQERYGVESAVLDWLVRRFS